MYSWKRHVMLHQPDRSSLLYPSTPLIRYLARRGDATFLPTASSFRGSTAMIYSLESAGGYESLLPERVQNFWRVVAEGEHPDELESHPLIYAYQPRPQLDSLRPALLARAGVAYVVAGPRDVDAGPGPSGLVLRYDGADGRVYAVSGALPRAYVVGGCDEAATPLAALEHVVAPGFAAGRTAVLERSFLRSARVSCGGDSPGRVGTAVVRDRRTNSLLVHVDARRTGWLVVNESWERGWTASIDGRSADVLPANYAMRAVRVPPGAHDVQLTYRPSSFRLGAGISALAFVLTLGGLGGPSLLARVRGRA
jgi:hypothetical protein